MRAIVIHAAEASLPIGVAVEGSGNERAPRAGLDLAEPRGTAVRPGS